MEREDGFRMPHSLVAFKKFFHIPRLYTHQTNHNEHPFSSERKLYLILGNHRWKTIHGRPPMTRDCIRTSRPTGHRQSVKDHGSCRHQGSCQGSWLTICIAPSCKGVDAVHSCLPVLITAADVMSHQPHSLQGLDIIVLSTQMTLG